MSDTIDRLNAALEGRYRIERELGAGGMATVYLAEDLKHHRQVAIKVLKPELAAVLGAERFVQEITTTANLQHPHILPLFDSGTADGFLFYVMPYIEGETLREKLDRETQLGIEEAVRITREVADALDYAHRRGIVHRDIKPENILLHDGRPMVADFGIALAVSAAAGGRMTETGTSLGTPHYMSPEQATADKEITARSDVYSLGSVLYEMLAGDPPHIGSSAQQVIMKIITDTPRLVSELRKSVPPNVAAAVMKAVEKLPADRFESAKAFADALADPRFGETGRGPPGAGASGMATRWPLIGALALAALLLIVALIGWLRPIPATETVRQRVVLWHRAESWLLDPGAERWGAQAAIAPDGSSIVFTDSVEGAFRLMRKRRNEAKATPLAGTEGAMNPFFSPKGQWVGYYTSDGKLLKTPIDGGGSLPLADDVDPNWPAAAWLEGDTIVYAGEHGVLEVGAGGGTGTPVRLDTMDTGRAAYAIWPLPGGRSFLYTRCRGNCAYFSSIHAFDLDTREDHVLVDDAMGAWYSPTGHLLYTSRAGGLFAAPLDLGRLELTGGAVPVIPDVLPGSFTISPSGSVLYSTTANGLPRAGLVWVSRDGTAVPVDTAWSADFHYPAISPRGTIAVTVTEGRTRIWLRRPDGTLQRLTPDGLVSWRPSWTPDGSGVLFASIRESTGMESDLNLYRLPADGGAAPQLVRDHPFAVYEGEISPDSQWLAFRSDEPLSRLYVRRLHGDTALASLPAGSPPTTQLSISPDGSRIAFTVNQQGQYDIMVAPFPDLSTTRVISRDGGTEPRWSRNGRELFFKSRGELMAVDALPGSATAFGTPHALFSVAPYRAAINRPEYDVAPDGRFLMIRELAGDNVSVVWVENWLEELKEKMRQ